MQPTPIRSVPLTAALADYLLRDVNEPEVLQQLRIETEKLPSASMQIGPDQGKFMRWLTELIGAKKCLEVGVFTGYSSLCVALGMSEGGCLIACDIDPEITRIAKRYWQRAGVAENIQLELRPAVETLDRLIAEGNADSFDFVFIDADKESYDAYYEASLVLVRRNGLILIDNTLWSGAVANPSRHDPDTQAIARLNQKISTDNRVSACLLPIGDGLTLVRKQ
ncbi:MAG TPA: class I SAM-dependent methyltransferase [Polyangiaceae bacterium]|nr:class I SAM-dependent methyltransferase [Polyangiaceae bacterium]